MTTTTILVDPKDLADPAPPNDDASAPVVLGERLRVVRTGPALVVMTTGVLDARCIDELDALLGRCADVPVVIDLDGCTLVGRSAIDGIDPARWDRTPADTCVTSSRSTARELLARARVGDRIAVFDRVVDAVQVLVLAEAGYGTGWRA